MLTINDLSKIPSAFLLDPGDTPKIAARITAACGDAAAAYTEKRLEQYRTLVAEYDLTALLTRLNVLGLSTPDDELVDKSFDLEMGADVDMSEIAMILIRYQQYAEKHWSGMQQILQLVVNDAKMFVHTYQALQALK